MASKLVGQLAPNFTLPSTTEATVSLADYDGKWKVLFFYAKDGSPTCKRGCLTFKEQ
jgi:peroxiredoxin Q/BCP